jgi:toxin ParE1/3/4
MAVEVVWLPQSLEDIDNIAEYIASESPTYATIQAERFFERALILEQFPLSGRIVPEFDVDEIRELIIGSFRMIYLVASAERVEILAVHRSSMLLQNNPTFNE